MTGGMAKYWIIPRVRDKELPRVSHLTGLLQSPHFLSSYVLMEQIKLVLRGSIVYEKKF